MSDLVATGKSSSWPPGKARRLGSGGYHGETSQHSMAVNWAVFGGELMIQDTRSREMNKPLQQAYLVRHGETEWSLSGKHTGITDIPLTANGRRVAKLFAPLSAKMSFALVLTSPLERARTTCELAGLGGQADRCR